MKLRVMTYNIRWGKGVDGKFSLERVAGIIREAGADLVGLQEVERGSPRSRFRDEPAVIARQLGMHVAFGGSLRLGTWQFGNALLSRFPLHTWRNVPLPPRRGPADRPAPELVPARRSISPSKLLRRWAPGLLDRRGVLVASVPLAVIDGRMHRRGAENAEKGLDRSHSVPSLRSLRLCGEIQSRSPAAEQCLNVLVTHLPLSYRVRLAHARVILELLRAASGPALLMGDFNEGPSGPTVTLFSAEGGLENVSGLAPTFPSRMPTSKLDYILVSPGLGGAGEPRVIPSPASDHLPVVAEIELPE